MLVEAAENPGSLRLEHRHRHGRAIQSFIAIGRDNERHARNDAMTDDK
ncbi:MAG: hypothetical protein L3J91_07165 [Thermoplasmata archaeon]|nr:hypothetical protein [Thermoplasmata archaeon]